LNLVLRLQTRHHIARTESYRPAWLRDIRAQGAANTTALVGLNKKTFDNCSHLSCKKIFSPCLLFPLLVDAPESLRTINAVDCALVGGVQVSANMASRTVCHQAIKRATTGLLPYSQQHGLPGYKQPTRRVIIQ